MSTPQDLLSLGFTELPGLDPDYFAARLGVGFFVLVSESRNQFYAIHTINAQECTSSIVALLNGAPRDRAVALKKALQESKIADWSIFFRQGSPMPGLRAEVREVLSDMQELRQGQNRMDPEAPVDVWYVEYPLTNYACYVVHDSELDFEKAAGLFMRGWREAIDNGNRDKHLDLARYYKAAAHQGLAMKDWFMDRREAFIAHRVAGVAGGTRRDVRAFTRLQNHGLTALYYESLMKAAPAHKRPIELETHE